MGFCRHACTQLDPARPQHTGPAHTKTQVVFFGHRDVDAVSLMTSLTVRSATNATRTLRLSARHFVPTLIAAGGLHHKYARDVLLGDHLLLLGTAGDSVEGVVVDKSTHVDRGLYNPYTEVGGGQLGTWAGTDGAQTCGMSLPLCCAVLHCWGHCRRVCALYSSATFQRCLACLTHPPTLLLRAHPYPHRRAGAWWSTACWPAPTPTGCWTR